jgi:hypothetical protein
MNWRPAKSILKLRDQINAMYPNRDKTSDGIIGDTAHSARKSDHNPNGAGVVTAIDIDKDLDSTNPLAMKEFIIRLQDSFDPRIKYIIFDGQITVKGDIHKWKPYHGANSHKHHCHISVSSNAALYDSDKDWKI